MVLFTSTSPYLLQQLKHGYKIKQWIAHLLLSFTVNWVYLHKTSNASINVTCKTILWHSRGENSCKWCRMEAECLSSCSHSSSVLLSHKINANAYSGVRAIVGPFLYILLHVYSNIISLCLMQRNFPTKPSAVHTCIYLLSGRGRDR